MAVRFEQPQPLSPAIAGVYGAGLTRNQNNAVLQRQLEGGTQARLAAAQAEAGRRQAAAAQNLALAQRQTEADYANLQRGAGLEADVRTRQADREHAANMQSAALTGRANQLQAQGQLQAQLQAREFAERQNIARLQSRLAVQELSFREEQRLNQLKGLVPEVMSDPDLTPRERRVALAQLAAGIDPLERRREAAQARQMEQHAKLYEQQAALQAQVQERRQALSTMAFEQRVRPMTLPDGSTALFFQSGVDNNGQPKWEQIDQSKSPQARAVEAETKAQQDYAALRMKIADFAVKRAEAEARGIEQEGGTPSPSITHDWTNRLLDEAGVGRTWEEHRRKLGLGGTGTPPPPGGQPPPGDQQRQPPPKPFDQFDPSTQTDRQKALVAEYNARQTALANDPTLYQGQKEPILAARRGRFELVQKYGGKPHEVPYSPEDAKRYEELGAVEVPAPPAQAAPAGPTMTPLQKFARGELVTTKDLFGG